jgi:hypothetical protein
MYLPDNFSSYPHFFDTSAERNKRKSPDLESITTKKVKEVVFAAHHEKRYFFPRTLCSFEAVKTKSLKEITTHLIPIDAAEISRFNSSLDLIAYQEKSLFKSLKTAFKQPLLIEQKKSLIEDLFYKHFFYQHFRQSIKNTRNYNFIDGTEEDYLRVSCYELALKLRCEKDRDKKKDLSSQWIKSNQDHPLDLKIELEESPPEIMDFFLKAQEHATNLLYPDKSDLLEISKTQASCFWVRFISYNLNFIDHVKFLFLSYPNFLKNLFEECKFLIQLNAIELPENLKKTLRVESQAPQFNTFCQYSSHQQLAHFFSYCLKKNENLFCFHVDELEFTDILKNFEKVQSGLAGAFICSLLNEDEPCFIYLKERFHIDYAISKLDNLKHDLKENDFIQMLKVALNAFPIRKPVMSGSSTVYIDVDELNGSLILQTDCKRQFQSLYFWKALFSQYPQYIHNNTLKNILFKMMENSVESFKILIESHVLIPQYQNKSD